MNHFQRTLKRPATCSGVGVHSGRQVNLTVKPAPANHGIKFVRTDLPDFPEVSAHFNQVVDSSLATVIGNDGCIVSTIEHLMASLVGLSIDNAIVELDAYEMPIMDGSALPFTQMLKAAGIDEQCGPKCVFIVKKPIELKEANRSVAVYPYAGFKVTCSIEYPHPIINKQELTLELTGDAFEKEVASARTFGFLHEYEQLKQFGLARGGSLENVVVVDEKSVLNEGGLRFEDEFVRHKILDCIGDFALLGMPLIGHLVTEKTGHGFNHAFLKNFLTQKDCWETLTLHQIDSAFGSPPKQLAI